MNNSDIGQYELIIKDLINPYNPIKNNNFFKNTRDKNISSPKIKNKIINKLNSTQVNQMGNDLNPMNCEYSSYQQKKNC
jgi:hypothetical protein